MSTFQNFNLISEIYCIYYQYPDQKDSYVSDNQLTVFRIWLDIVLFFIYNHVKAWL